MILAQLWIWDSRAAEAIELSHMCNWGVFLQTQNAYTWVFLLNIQIVGDIWNRLSSHCRRESINKPSTFHNARHRFRYVYSQADRLYELQNRVDYHLKCLPFKTQY